MRLTTIENEINIVHHKDIEFIIDFSFDNVLRAMELNDDDFFNNNDKIAILLEMFIVNIEDIKGLNFYDAKDIIRKIFDKTVANENGDNNSNESKKVFCFKQDAEYIYSSFKAEYGIDLIDEQGSLSWFKFISLLKGLPDTSKFKEIVSIRSAKLPKATKGNNEERKRLIELKRVYALKEEDQLSGKKKSDVISDKLSAIGEMYVNSRSK